MKSYFVRLNGTVTRIPVFFDGPADFDSPIFMRCLAVAIAGDLDFSRALRAADPWDAISLDDTGRTLLVGRLREMAQSAH